MFLRFEFKFPFFKYTELMSRKILLHQFCKIRRFADTAVVYEALKEKHFFNRI